MIYAFRTEKGLRKVNEDCCRIPEDGERPLVIVADGMGGHRAGNVASRTAIDTIRAVVTSSTGTQSPAMLLRQAVNSANRKIFDVAQHDVDCMGMGTTVVLALLSDRTYTCAHIGDSRLYQFDGSRIHRITRDHSYVEELVASGYITEEQARTHPQRNILTRAVGTSRFEKADVNIYSWRRNEIILLCSDGLHGSVTDEEMEHILRSERDLLRCCDLMVELALDNGSTDNITVVLAKNETNSLKNKEGVTAV